MVFDCELSEIQLGSPPALLGADHVSVASSASGKSTPKRRSERLLP
jgi:hypothetical protein